MLINITVFLAAILFCVFELRNKRLKVAYMWILPILLIGLFFKIIWQNLFINRFSLLIIGICFIAGIFAGIFLGSLMHIEVNRSAGEITVRSKPIGLVFWLVMFAAKRFTRPVLEGNVIFSSQGFVISMFLSMWLGTFISKRIYLYWKYTDKVKQKARR